MRQTRLLPLFCHHQTYIRERRKATLSLTDIFPFKFLGKRCSSSVRLNVPSLFSPFFFLFIPDAKVWQVVVDPVLLLPFPLPLYPAYRVSVCVCRGIKGKGASSIESENATLPFPLLPFSTTSTATLSLSLSSIADLRRELPTCKVHELQQFLRFLPIFFSVFAVV